MISVKAVGCDTGMYGCDPWCLGGELVAFSIFLSGRREDGLGVWRTRELLLVPLKVCMLLLVLR